MSRAPSWPPPGEVHVYHADVNDLLSSPSRAARWRQWLSHDEEARHARFLHDHDRRMFLCGRGMARELVGRALGVAPDAWPWREGPHGRPEIALDGTSVRFNVAHSAGVVVCGLASDGEVGVDVEHLRRRPVDRALVTRYFAPGERADIEAQGDTGWHDRFLRYWTLKEAYLKARGLGIAVPLIEISFRLNGTRADVEFLGSLAGTPTNWMLELFEPGPDHVAAVAATEGKRGVFHRFE